MTGGEVALNPQVTKAGEAPLLDIRGLKTHFATDDGIVQAVDGVDLTVGRGETVSVVGESGCGKTVTALSVLKLIAMPPGRIAAGQPIEAVEHAQTISLADFVQSKEVYVLEVRGESMQDEHILDGDYVLVERVKTAHNGDIVVALVDENDATLKRFYREGDNIRLQPSNAAMKPIIVPAAAVQVQGRVIGVLRKY